MMRRRKKSSADSSNIMLLGLEGMFIILVSAAAVSATDHIVGANKGWNPGINYTLWSNNHTFYVGDLISFRYQKTMYNVFEVNETGYDNCTTEGALGNWSSGKDFITLDKAQRYYFICGNGQCYNGMKVSVLVHTLPTPQASSSNHSSSSPSASASARSVDDSLLLVYYSCRGTLVGFWALIVTLLAHICCSGSGWI